MMSAANLTNDPIFRVMTQLLQPRAGEQLLVVLWINIKKGLLAHFDGVLVPYRTRQLVVDGTTVPVSQLTHPKFNLKYIVS